MLMLLEVIGVSDIVVSILKLLKSVERLKLAMGQLACSLMEVGKR